MIKLTLGDGRPFIANPELLEGIFPSSDGNETHLKYSGSSNVTVIESYEEVARKVLEWRLSMIQYAASFQADANWAANKFLGKDGNYPFIESAGTKKYIEHLAGLEEPK